MAGSARGELGAGRCWCPSHVLPDAKLGKWHPAPARSDDGLRYEYLRQHNLGEMLALIYAKFEVNTQNMKKEVIAFDRKASYTDVS